MDRRAAIATATAGIVAVLFVAVATAGSVEFVDGSATSSGGPPTTIAQDRPEFANAGDSPPWEVPGFVEVILRLVFFACVAIVAWLIVRYAWRHRPRLRWSRRRRPGPVDFDVLDEVAVAITSDADAQQAALRRGTPRNAIVECWLRLETAVVAAGVPRQPADTSTDLMLRVLATRRIEPTAIATLAALYREARFSDHPMTEESRRDAIDALDVVHQGLRSTLTETVATP
ncbi:MAG: DUF4129 domain-containing protein [Ilumatobacteraceae bacterium]